MIRVPAVIGLRAARKVPVALESRTKVADSGALLSAPIVSGCERREKVLCPDRSLSVSCVRLIYRLLYRSTLGSRVMKKRKKAK